MQRQPAQARVARHESGIHMRSVWRRRACGPGFFSLRTRLRRNAACQRSWCSFSRRVVSLKAKRSRTSSLILAPEGESGISSYRIRVSDGVNTLFVRSAHSATTSTTALRRLSKSSRSARIQRWSSV
jgi:hypothetical protein